LFNVAGARCFIGLNGNKVQSLGCPRNGKQINPLHGFCTSKNQSLAFYVTSSRGARQRWEDEVACLAQSASPDTGLLSADRPGATPAVGICNDRLRGAA